LAVEAQMCSVSSHVADVTGLLADSVQLNFEEAASILLQMKEVLALDHLPDGAVVQKLHHIQVLLE
jgi:hypothetical protein